MNSIINKMYQNNTVIYKVFLFLFTTIAVVYLFPKGGHFKYDFNNGQLWKYDNLYAPFDYAIRKTDEEIKSEIKEIKSNTKPYFLYDSEIEKQVLSDFEERISSIDADSLGSKKISKIGQQVILKIFKTGFLDKVKQAEVLNKKEIVAVRKGNEVEDRNIKSILDSEKVEEIIENSLYKYSNLYEYEYLLNALLKTIRPNIVYDEDFTSKIIENDVKNISYTKGKIEAGKLIISKGDIVEGKKLAMLNSLKSESESQVWTDSNYNWIFFGYTILVSLALLMLLLFLKKYKSEIFDDNTKVTFIFFNVLSIIFVQTLVIEYNSEYLYIVPLCILPIVLRTFFDIGIGLFTHLLTVLLLGYIAPNSFEFIYLHIIAGIVSILTVSKLYRRADLFISAIQITITYMVTYFAFSVINEGNVSQIKWTYFMLFVVNGLLSFLAVILIYIYEKVFGLVSDITLLELSNTNTKLLRELNEKAPGTFQHSVQVANISEAVANELNANSMLVRTGALYHDIGKMLCPLYFIENQLTGVNPHNDLSPIDSSKIIIDHVIKGVELAKKHRLPDRIIDFIRTHHGTSTTYYFYMKEKELNSETPIDLKKFRYKGPNPFSKETAILMMCDASEAASKSLKKPSAQSISKLVDKVVDRQISENQFLNSNITFREVEIIKKVIKTKLMNIYHLRVEYPK